MTRHPARYALAEGNPFPEEGLGGLAHDDGEDELALVRVDEEDGPIEGTEEGAHVLHHAVEDAAYAVLGDDARPDRGKNREPDKVVQIGSMALFGHEGLLITTMPRARALDKSSIRLSGITCLEPTAPGIFFIDLRISHHEAFSFGAFRGEGFRMKSSRNRIGTIFLFGALAGFLFFSFQPWLPLSSLILFRGLSLNKLILAFFDAALVGALADWFAVTALFRDPLGLKLPHTSILTKNKDLIAEAVPRFLTGFVSYERIADELSRVDFSAKLESSLGSGKLREELHRLLQGRISAFLAAYASGSGPRVVSLSSFVGELCDFAAENVDPAPAFAGLLGWARRESYDEKILEGVADLLRSEIARNRPRLAALITPIVKRNAGWKGLFIGRGTMEELLRGIEEELSVFRSNRDHELRTFLVGSIVHYAESLSAADVGDFSSPEKGAFNAMVREALRDKGFQKGLGDFLSDLLGRLGFDLAKADSRFIEGLERLEDGLVGQLAKDPDLRSRLNQGIATMLTNFVTKGHFIEGLSQYLAGLLKATDPKEFVERVEDSVWNDLQYIRVNGAVVGGIVGLLLSLLSTLIPG